MGGKNGQIFTCPKCGAQFTAKGALVWHMLKHRKTP